MKVYEAWHLKASGPVLIDLYMSPEGAKAACEKRLTQVWGNEDWRDEYQWKVKADGMEQIDSRYDTMRVGCRKVKP